MTPQDFTSLADCFAFLAWLVPAGILVAAAICVWLWRGRS